MKGKVKHTDYNLPYLHDSTIQEIFERVANLHSDKIAVKQGDECLSYRDLNSKSNAVAGLLRSRGVQIKDYVGISSNRSIEMVVGLLAILKVGAAYVPIDFSLPSSRLKSMFQAAAIKVCLLTNDYGEPVKLHDIEYIDINRKIFDFTFEPIITVNGGKFPAYVNFSSGTTGEPKGIVCTHRGVIRLLFNQNYLAFTSDIVILQVAPISFDAATFEIWGALLHGGKCILSADDGFVSCSDIREAITKDNVNIMFLTSALFNTLVDIDAKCFERLKTLLSGGDVASIKHIRKLYEANETITLINCYGPTENTTFSTYYVIPREIIDSKQLTIPIGRSIEYTQTYIMNEDGMPTLEGEVGEIYLSGDGLANEYLNNRDLTAKCFISHDVEGVSTRMYKTGDLGYFNANGYIEFTGRIDTQVKINGYRGDIGEIENCINGYCSVKASTVLIHVHDSGDKFLVAFVVGNKNHENELNNYLKNHLPSYFLPQKIIWLDNLPMTTTGKVNKKLLKNHLIKLMLPFDSSDYNGFNSSDPIEEKIRKIWRDILGVTNINLSDNFFSLGGTSLGLIKLAQSIDDAFNLKINNVNFYQEPTIHFLKREVNLSKNKQKISLKKRDAEMMVGLTKNQLRFYNQYKLNLAETNMNIVFQIVLETDKIAELMESLSELIADNRIFKCRTIMQDGEIIMHYSPDFEPDILVYNCSEIDDDVLGEAISVETKHMFNLLVQTPLRVRVWKANKYVAFVFNVHHLYFDGSSMYSLKKIIRELAAGKIYSKIKLDYLDFCEQSDSMNHANDNFLDDYLKYIGKDQIFSLSDFTHKNESYVAEGYQIAIDKKSRVTSIEPGTVKGTELALGRLGGDRAKLDEMFEGYEYLVPQNVAQAIYWAASLPENVNINRIDMMATCQVFANLSNAKNVIAA